MKKYLELCINLFHFSWFLPLGYHFISETTNTDEHVLYQKRVFCNTEEATLVSTDAVLLSQEFINDALLLPTSYVQRDYMDFINRWGTVSYIVPYLCWGVRYFQVNAVENEVLPVFVAFN